MDRKLAIKELETFFSKEINYNSEDLEDQIDPLKYKSPEGDNCLHLAAIRGNLRAIELLLDLGFDIDSQGDMGQTALHYSATFKHKEAYELLIRRGAAKDILNEFGKMSGDYSDD